MRPMRYSSFLNQAILIKARLNTLNAQIGALSATEEHSEQQLARIKTINEVATKKNADFENNISKLFSADTVDEDIKESEIITLQEEISDLYIQIHSACSTLIPEATDKLNQSHNSTSSNAPQSSGVRLPPLNLGVFSGQPEKWMAFHSLFESTVHKNPSLADVEKFSYLLSCLCGEPLNIVKSLPITSANYHIAYQQLYKRYHNSRLLISLHINNILDMPNLYNCSVQQLRTFISFYQENVNALKVLGHDLGNESLFLTSYLLRKFDSDFRSKFEHSRSDSDTVPEITEFISFIEKECAHLEAANLTTVSSKSLPHTASEIKEFISFVEKECANLKAAHSSKVSSKGSLPSGHKPNTKPFRTTASPKTALLSASPAFACTFCASTAHNIYKCDAFAKLTPAERLKFVQNNSLCNNCLSRHNVRNCLSLRHCSVCNRRHHTMLHIVARTPAQQPTIPKKQLPADTTALSTTSRRSEQRSSSPLQTPISTAMVGISHSNNESVLLATALVQLTANDRSTVVRAVLDSAAQHSFITEGCALALNLHYTENNCSQVLGISSASILSKGVTQVTITSLGGHVLTNNHSVIILEQITGHLPSHTISPRVRERMKHLVLADPTFDTPAPVDVLIGADLFPQAFLGEIIDLGKGMPSAFSTIFGYVLMGTSPTLTKHPQQYRSVNLLTTDNFDLHHAIQKFWITENPPDTPLRSPAEEACELHFKQTHRRLDDGRYEVRLPLKESPTVLGNSSISALTIFKSLETRLGRNPELREKYISFMRDYRESGHMVPYTTSHNFQQPKYFLPHHGVLRDDKIRVVFNASAPASNGLSLNSILYTGEKLHNEIPDIIFSFRQHRIVFTTDARQMFRNIWVHPEDQPLQLIYWREKPSAPLQVFQLTTVTYGMSSSPFLANRVILQLIKDEGQQHPLAAVALRKGLYVDDALLGADSVEEALQLQDDVIQLMKKGGFSLRKWSSNHHRILEAVPADFIATPLHFSSDLPVCNILGLKWLPEKDGFSYLTKSSQTQLTKRSVLSSIAQIFDPLGWISPTVFWAKAFMQILWTKGLQWDDPLPADLSLQWTRFLNELPCLEQILILRHVDSSAAESVQLHGFCDASESGYCALVLLRIQRGLNDIKIYVLIAKSRVAPLKRVSLPRLELNGAHLLSKLLQFCTTHLSTYMSIDEVFAWCDSTVTLSWIKTPAYRLKTYVANRVSEIQATSIPIIWTHIASVQNPADCGSRGLMPSLLPNHPLWWKGPAWLSSPQSLWPSSFCAIPPIEDLPEVKPTIATALHATARPPSDILRRFSSWTKLLHVTAYILRFVHHAEINTSSGLIKRPVVKLSLLPVSEELRSTV